MTQAEMIDNMYEKFGEKISKAALERALQKIFADIHSLCMDRDRSPVTVRSFGTANIPPGKRIVFRNSKDMFCTENGHTI